MENPDYVYWCELRGARGGTLRASPIEVAPLLEQGLFGRIDSAILTSATLAVGGDLGFIRRRLGAGDCRERQVSSPFLYEEQAVLCAVERAREAGVPTNTPVLNLLHRLVDGTPTDQPDVTPPSALALSKEPEANVSRYDGLRQGGTRHAS